MKNRCLEREQIFELAQGMAGEREAASRMAHLENCAECRKVFAGYQRLDDVLSEWNPQVEPSPWFDARVRAAAASGRAARGASAFFGPALHRWLAVPVLASLLVVVGTVVLRHRSRVNVPSAPVAAAAHVAVPPAPAGSQPPAAPQTGAQEVNMYQNLSVLEDYDMLAGFDVISELPKGSGKVAD
ncbi:MAG TPA: hypothetical protein VGZ29_09045 [Terriglobia bacterium]|nr:hypothetical protein [Terriglobia bacterium]